MKKRLKIILWVLGSLVILGISFLAIHYVVNNRTYKPYQCPKGYRDGTLSGYSDIIRNCTDCELTRAEYELGKEREFNDECKAIEKTCYVCIQYADPLCDCMDEHLYLKID